MRKSWSRARATVKNLQPSVRARLGRVVHEATKAEDEIILGLHDAVNEIDIVGAAALQKALLKFIEIVEVKIVHADEGLAGNQPEDQR